LPEQRRSLHDLAGLAISRIAERCRLPGALDRVSAIGAQTLDGDDLVSGRIGEAW